MAADAVKVGAGAIGGAGVSLALFTVLPIGKLLTGTSFPLEYPLAIFGLVSLFVLIAAVCFRPVPPSQGVFVWIGILVFAVIGLAGVAVIYRVAWSSPTVTLVESLEPAPGDFRDPDSIKPISLQLQYQLPGAVGAAPLSAPFSGSLKIRGGQPVTLRLVGFSELTDKYHGYVTRLETLRAMMSGVCGRNPSDVVCYSWNDLQGR